MDVTSRTDHEAVVDRQFGGRADAYVASAAHSAGVDLDRIEAVARQATGGIALDLGCGGGHVAYRVAPHMARVVATDLSPRMLAAVEAEAARRGLGNIETCEAPAETLPFADGRFDLTLCRFSAHHWRDLDAGLGEARRVTKAGGRGVFVDVTAPADPLLDTHLQAVELLRDPSHVRDYRLDEWLAALGRAGFEVTGLATHRLPMAFDDWTARMATPPVQVAAIRALQEGASTAIIDAFAIAGDGSFTIDVAAIEVVRR